MDIYRKPTSTDTVIHFTSNQSVEHLTAAIRCLLIRMHQLSLISRNKKKAWTTILHITKTNGFPLLTKLNSLILHKIPSRVPNTENTTQKISVTFTFNSPVVRKLTNLCHNTKIKIAFRSMNTVHSILRTRSNNTFTKYQRLNFKHIIIYKYRTNGQ